MTDTLANSLNLSVFSCEILVDYSETIATHVPPTFRGIYVKYSYKLTIGTQRVNCPTTLIRVPFRVLVLPGKCRFSQRFDSRKREPWIFARFGQIYSSGSSGRSLVSTRYENRQPICFFQSHRNRFVNNCSRCTANSHISYSSK
jgi:hypothetical protein